MSKEVDRILTLYTGKTGMHLDVVKRELSEAGVVIKVEDWLPIRSGMVCTVEPLI